MVRILNGTYRFVPNYGLVIIILSVLVRVVLFPLNQTSMRSMKAMQRLQPEMETLKKKYAEKPQELNKHMMLLYKKHNFNPLGGCLPMVVQMPVLFALYFAFMFAIDLRMAPFGLWIRDLSAPDTIGKIAGFPIHVLPLIMTAVSVLQARTTPTDPRQATMTTLMPVMFLVFFYSMPAGLVLYWTMSNLATWLQQLWVNRGEHARAAATAAAAGEAEAGGGRGACGERRLARWFMGQSAGRAGRAGRRALRQQPASSSAQAPTVSVIAPPAQATETGRAREDGERRPRPGDSGDSRGDGKGRRGKAGPCRRHGAVGPVEQWVPGLPAGLERKAKARDRHPRDVQARGDRCSTTIGRESRNSSPRGRRSTRRCARV
jgi:YidC/Oxa1 family membrane protein insertase